ncbi:MAG: hypothetical protein QM638_03510 [Nocardioides sp.]|uniref:hypothetical protein n=1 Tax=Nocardioides sp. TaxID=35761 RepID=UPI0039E3AE8C
MRIPSLLGTYGAIERRLEPRLQELVQAPEFARTVALLAEVRSAVGGTVGRLNARVLHTLNLPASTDVTGLRRQIGELDHEVRTLRIEIGRLIEESDDAE